MKSLQKQDLKKYLINSMPYLVFFIVSILIMLPLTFGSIIHGHDIEYHFQAINALDLAYKNGTFFSRIFELTCQDFGYATGLFYSMIPSSLIVLLKNWFNLPAIVAASIIVSIILFLSATITFKIFYKITKNRKKSTLMSILYIIFPYTLTNIYIRYALTEMFITFLLPLIFLAFYELLEEKNHFKFSIYFIIGFSLSIMIHFTLTLYIAIFAFIFLMINYKEFFNKKNIIVFSISSAIVLLISATYYIPMIISQKDINIDIMSKSGKSLWEWTFVCFKDLDTHKSLYYFLSAYIIFIIFILFCVYFIIYWKKNTTRQKQLFIMSIILVVTVTPLAFYWFVIEKTKLSLIQFPFRLYLFCGILTILQIIYLLYRIKPVLFKYFIIAFYVFYSSVTFLCYIGFYINNTDKYFNERINMLSTNNGCGSGKYGDYLPKGATMDYVFNRAKDMILETNSEILEIANYQSLKQICFVIKAPLDSYVVLDLPYEICQDIKIYQYDTTEPFGKFELEAKSQTINGKDYLKMNFVNNYYTRTYEDNESKIIIDYLNSEVFENYLRDNPFEFIVLSGDEDAKFTNFIKENSHTYTVDIDVNEATKIELPTLYYSGYKVTYKVGNEIKELKETRSENGFIEIEVSEKGTLSIEYKSVAVSVSNVISIIGLLAFIGFEIGFYYYEKKIKSSKNKSTALENK